MKIMNIANVGRITKGERRQRKLSEREREKERETERERKAEGQRERERERERALFANLLLLATFFVEAL